jgi:yecA family protein
MTHDEALTILNDFLNSPERSKDCFNLHQFRGGMVAIHSCPKYVSEADLGFLALGDDEKGVSQWFDDEKIRIAWVTCMNETSEALAMGRFTLKDCYAIEESATAPDEELSHWCDGYLQAYELTEEAWVDACELLASGEFTELDEEHMAFLGLLAVLAEWDQALDENKDPEHLRRSFPVLYATVDEAIIKMHHLAQLLEECFVHSEIESETFVRESAKIGRNDPCPCGSGKKYKKCCLN